MYDSINDKRELWQNDRILRAFGISIVAAALAMPVLLLMLSIIVAYVKPV